MTEAPTRSRLDMLRDTIACTSANWILNHIATKWYRTRVNGLLAIGITVATTPPEQDAP